eukprot:3933840-Prymnesium_polylepis.1
MLLLLIPLVLFKDILMVPVMEKKDDPGPNLWKNKLFLSAQCLGLSCVSAMYANVPFLQVWFYDTFGTSKSAFGLWFMGLAFVGFGVGAT